MSKKERKSEDILSSAIEIQFSHKKTPQTQWNKWKITQHKLNKTKQNPWKV